MPLPPWALVITRRLPPPSVPLTPMEAEPAFADPPAPEPPLPPSAEALDWTVPPAVSDPSMLIDELPAIAFPPLLPSPPRETLVTMNVFVIAAVREMLAYPLPDVAPPPAPRPEPPVPPLPPTVTRALSS